MQEKDDSLPPLDKKKEKIEYFFDEKNYLISLIYNSEEITFDIKRGQPIQYDQFESKFNLLELKSINQFFTQFENIDKIVDLYLSLLKNDKIKISEDKDKLNLSFINTKDNTIILSIEKKELIEEEKKDEKDSDIVKSLINEIKELKDENKKMKE